MTTKCSQKTLNWIKAVVRNTVRRFLKEEEIENMQLFSAGYEGYAKALHCFNPNKDSSFKHYAAIRIKGEVLDEIRRYLGRNDKDYKLKKFYFPVSKEDFDLEKIEDHSQAEENLILKIDLKQACKSLREKDLDVFQGLLEGLSQYEISKKQKVTESAISQRMKTLKAFSKKVLFNEE